MKILLLVGLLVVVGMSFLLWRNSDDTNLRNTDVTVTNSTEKNDALTSEVENDNKTALDLSAKGLTEVSPDVFTQTELTELDLSNNQLTGALPAEVRHLQKLKVLDLSNNKFTGVPAEIGQLKLLEILDLSNNQLTGLPNELGNLSNLKQLNLSGNAYAEADLVNIRKNLPADTVITVD